MRIVNSFRGACLALALLSALAATTSAGAILPQPVEDALPPAVADAIPEPPSAVEFGGPVVLAGIDAEDGGPGGHGPISTYTRVVQSILDDVSNAGNGILVVGGNAADFCTGAFWNEIGTGTSEPITFVEGASQISAQPLAGFAVIAVVGSAPETCGGLTQAENGAIGARRDEIAAFVNGGGGLIGFTQVNFSDPYSFVSGLGDFTMGNYFTSNINPTPAGEAIGIDDSLDVCCWHNSILTYPDYLEVLATYDNNDAAAIGGSSVVLCREDGINALHETPADGVASGAIHDVVEPAVTGVDGGAGEIIHGANCDFVVPVESLVDSHAAPPAPGTAHPSCGENGLEAADDTPAEGSGSGTVHGTVEPAVGGVDGSLGESVHRLNCDQVVPWESGGVDPWTAALRNLIPLP